MRAPIALPPGLPSIGTAPLPAVYERQRKTALRVAAVPAEAAARAELAPGEMAR
jgi:hypothetical protein